MLLGSLLGPRLSAAAAGERVVRGHHVGSPAVAIRVRRDRVSATITGAPLSEVLDAIARGTGLRVVRAGPLEEPVSDAFEALPVAQAVGRLLRGRSTLLVYAGGSLREVHVLAAAPAGDEPGTTHPTGTAPSMPPAIDALAAMSDPDAVAPLGAVLLGHDVAGTRAIAADALGRTWSARAVAPLGQALGADSDPAVRAAAARALGETWSRRAVAPLARALLEDPSGAVRREAAGALAEIGGAGASRTLLLALGDGDPGVRQGVVSALAEVGDARAEDGLLWASLEDHDAGVRGEAARALERVLR